MFLGLCYVHNARPLPVEPEPDPNLNHTAVFMASYSPSTSVTKGTINPFVYTTDHYVFKFSARPTPHRILEEATLSRLEVELATEIETAITKKGFKVTDPVPDNYIYIIDEPRTGAYLVVKGNKTPPSPLYQLKWVDLTSFQQALSQYLGHWNQVKRSSLVDIWIYGTADGLLAKGTAERGWPYIEDSSNSTNTQSISVDTNY